MTTDPTQLLSGPKGPDGPTGHDEKAQPSEKSAARRRWAVLAVLALAQLLISLDSTVVTVALPSAQAELGFSAGDRQWIITAYALGFGALLPLGGRLGDLFGRERVFLAGLAGFAVASGLGGAAQGFPMLVAARALQGVSGAILAPAALSLVSTTFALPTERARAFGVFGGISAGGGAVGLLLGGSMTEYLSWRWSLYVNVPLAVVAAGGALWLLTFKRMSGTRPRIDWLGATLVAGGLFSVVFGMSKAETSGWDSTGTIAWIGAGIVVLGAFIATQARVREPLLPLRVLADRTRAGSLLSIGVSGIGLFVTFLFMTFYMTELLGYGPLDTGFAFLPFIAALILASGVSATLASRVPTRVIVLVGMLTAAAGMLLFTQLPVDGTYAADVLPGMLVAGVGVGLFIAPAMGAATSGIDDRDAGVGSALVHVAQQVGGSMGVAALSAVVTSAAEDSLRGQVVDAASRAAAAVDGYQSAFAWTAAILAAGGVMAALLIRPGTVESSEAIEVPTAA
ncbi:MFS transporter [Streptomyces tauricus]|uniref:MFS transporter n=1 Tax=Streptomyces tauricus TaxID=68274 RepID=UPI0016760A11|nr:MFS transporter [Streptomyces tauricus]MCW8097777.1 MFS transporter [Streptomyces tauricus]GHA33496.1 MFS transporter [Streptomyces tauricus]